MRRNSANDTHGLNDLQSVFQNTLLNHWEKKRLQERKISEETLFWKHFVTNAAFSYFLGNTKELSYLLSI